jgi:hypothetical protein
VQRRRFDLALLRAFMFNLFYVSLAGFLRAACNFPSARRKVASGSMSKSKDGALYGQCLGL